MIDERKCEFRAPIHPSPTVTPATPARRRWLPGRRQLRGGYPSARRWAGDAADDREHGGEEGDGNQDDNTGGGDGPGGAGDRSSARAGEVVGGGAGEEVAEGGHPHEGDGEEAHHAAPRLSSSASVCRSVLAEAKTVIMPKPARGVRSRAAQSSPAPPAVEKAMIDAPKSRPR